MKKKKYRSLDDVNSSTFSIFSIFLILKYVCIYLQYKRWVEKDHITLNSSSNYFVLLATACWKTILQRRLYRVFGGCFVFNTKFACLWTVVE